MTTTETTVQTGACECGTVVGRERPVGRFGAFLDAVPFVCDDCIVHAKAEEHERAKAEEVGRSRAARDGRRRHAGLPSELRDISFSELDRAGSRATAIDAASQWAGGAVKGVALTGPIGVGKTRIAAAAVWAMCDRRPVRWMSAPLLFARLGSGFGSPQRNEALAVLTGKSALILDDLDKTRPTEYAAEHVFLAVDGRIDNGLPLLVTTNLSLAEIAARFVPPFGEALASRLAGYCKVVRLSGRDRRMEP